MELHWIDYLIVVGSILLAIGMGVYFAHRQKDTSTYFTGSGKVPAWAVGISIFATLISSVTFLAYPGAAYGGNWILLVQGLMVPVVLLALIWIIVPLFRSIIKLSTYEYFERRFGAPARYYSSVAFVLTHFTKMGSVFYLVSMAVAAFMEIDIYVVVGILAVTIIVLTLLGGMEAIIWMDVVQGFLLIGGGLLCVIFLVFAVGTPYTAGEIVGKAWDCGKISVGPFDWDFVNTTFWVMVLNGIFYALQKYGTDQTIVQRYLTARSDHEAKKAAFIGVFLSVPVWTMFMFIGSLLFAFYQLNPDPAVIDPETGAQLIKADAVFPHYISTQLPMGVRGIIIAAIAAAAISSLDADLNCLSAIAVQDYLAKLRPSMSDHQKLVAGRWGVVIAGLGAVGIALAYIQSNGGAVLETIFAFYAIFSAGIVGIFLLGLFSRHANSKGLYVGLIACILFTAYATLTSPMKMPDGTKRALIDLGAWNFTHSKYMLGVYSHLIVLVVGYLASFLFRHTRAHYSLTIYGFLGKNGEKPHWPKNK
ncbi:MAG: sodium:solute symporter [Bacteroidales bacterium]|nr:sodium:solute symporter [Bacteroidales bacterium]